MRPVYVTQNYGECMCVKLKETPISYIVWIFYRLFKLNFIDDTINDSSKFAHIPTGPTWQRGGHVGSDDKMI